MPGYPCCCARPLCVNACTSPPSSVDITMTGVTAGSGGNDCGSCLTFNSTLYTLDYVESTTLPNGQTIASDANTCWYLLLNTTCDFYMVLNIAKSVGTGLVTIGLNITRVTGSNINLFNYLVGAGPVDCSLQRTPLVFQSSTPPFSKRCNFNSAVITFN
jgi:hypothetical protein